MRSYLSTQHTKDVSNETLRDGVMECIIKPILPAEWLNQVSADKIHINPTGRFEIGGPQGDCGLTGRKIIVDTYGGMARHGGGAFSGKDPSKVDRSAAYMPPATSPRTSSRPDWRNDARCRFPTRSASRSRLRSR